MQNLYTFYFWGEKSLELNYVNTVERLMALCALALFFGPEIENVPHNIYKAGTVVVTVVLHATSAFWRLTLC